MKNILQPWGIPVILGVPLILLGLAIIFIADLRVLTAVISGFIFLAGLLEVIYIFTNKKRLDGWSFYLILAILYFVLAFLLIMVLDANVITLSLALSIWIVLQGLGKIVYSLDVQKLKVRNWDSDLIFGILFAVYGIMSIILISLSPAFFLLTTAFVLFLAGVFQMLLSLGRQAEYKSYLREIKIMFVKTTN